MANTISSWADLTEYIEEANQPVFVRWSDGPEQDREMGRSLNHQTGQRECGISVQRLNDKDLSKVSKRALIARMLIEYAFGRPTGYLCKAEVNGQGSDGEDTIDADTMTDVRFLTDDFVSTLDDYVEQFHSYKERHDELLTPPVDFDAVKAHEKPDPANHC